MTVSSPHHARQPTGARFASLLLAVLGILLAAGVVVTFFQVHRSMAAGRQESIRAGQALAEYIDHELENHISNVMAMRNLADSYLAGYLHRSGHPSDRLRFIPERQGYASGGPAPGEERASGRMVGLGEPPGRDSPVVEEMRMAEALTPLMRAIRDRSPDTPWVYYTSAKAFMYLFPAEEAEDFFFTPKLLDMEFLAGATPQANPSRKAFWTKPYQDEAGKGLMATVSIPVYQGDQFKGSVSIDVSVKNLQYIVDMHPLAHTDVALVSEDGQGLASRASSGAAGGERDRERFSLPLKQAPWRIELAADGQYILREALKAQVSHLVGVVLLAIALLVSLLLVRHARRIRELSIHDGLTGLYNRRYFDEIGRHHFDAARRGMARLGFIAADVDFFKDYNDTYGHPQGDQALVAVAQALQRSLLRGTDLAFRVGGEEFFVMVFLQEQETLHALLAKLNQAVRGLDLPHESNPSGRVTISLGAIVVDQDGWMDLEAAYRRVDEALYQAKTRGRDRHVLLERGPLQ